MVRREKNREVLVIVVEGVVEVGLLERLAEDGVAPIARDLRWRCICRRHKRNL